jgi:hypothetical protein
MGIRVELADFLNNLPAVDSPDERKALLTFTGLPELGIYLDWQGSGAVFTEQLLRELSRRGKGTLLGFLTRLATNTPQVAGSFERQAVLVALRAQVDALNEVAFRAEFPVPSGVPLERPPADPAMLAATVVNEVLVPYYKLGADQLRQKAGGRAVSLAEGMAEKVEQELAGDLAAGALLGVFKQNPEAGQAGMAEFLKAKLEGDPALTGGLAGLFRSAAAGPEGGGLQALVKVSHDIGMVRGDFVRAVVGPDVLKGIGAKIDVDEGIDTVEEVGGVVGAVSGARIKGMNIDRQHHDGTVFGAGGVANIGPGAHVSGDFAGRRKKRPVSIDVPGDFAGRGKRVEGDSLPRDKSGGWGDVRPVGDGLIGGDRSANVGFAIGDGAQRTGTIGVTGGEPTQLFGSIYEDIEARPEDPDVDKEELVGTVKKIEKEAAKGDKANANKVGRWLRFLADMAPDIKKVTAAALANPAAGVATAIRKIAEKAQAGA